MNKQFVMALIASGALVGLGGCSEGDNATINIDAPTTDNSVGGNICSGDGSCSSNGDNGGTDPVPETCPSGTTQLAEGICELSGRLSTDVTLVAGNEYRLNGRVIVGNGNCELTSRDTCSSGEAVQRVTLTIEPGVEVKGMTSSDPLTAAVLDVNRGSQLVAIGTADAPIIFSSASDDDYEGSGEWGGIQLSGYAPHNACDTSVCNIDGEGGVNFIGGDDPADSSGNLQYVIITEGGTELSTGDEVNGLSLNAVGSGTVMDFIQINDNLDDGVEFYGGTANIKHLVVTGAGDDSVDWDEGFQGNLQYVLVKQTANSGGEAFEMDTEGTTAWLSKPTVVNGTIIADKAAGEAAYSLNFKKSSGGFFHNMVVTVNAESANTFTTCATIHDGAEDNVGTALAFNNWVQDCASDGTGGILADVSVDATTVTIAPAELNTILASQASAATGLTAIDWVGIGAVLELPNSGSGDPQDFDASFFDDTTYAGAVDPAATTAWWAGWTLSGTL